VEDDETAGKEYAMSDERMMCRDDNGHFRLMPNVNIMDALDKLGLIEERAMGVLVVPPAGARIGSGWHCRECEHFDGPPHGKGKCLVHPDKDSKGNVRGPHRIVQAARNACADKFRARPYEESGGGADWPPHGRGRR
jgi:hypothetical protein